MLGIFDSGLGGLTITKEILSQLPKYQIIYFGDTARTPYGSRSPEVIYSFTQEAVDFLFKKGAELIIIACATASSSALRRIQQEYLPKNYPQKRVLGVIRPLAEEAVKITKNKKIGVVGTRATINSGAFIREIKKLLPSAEVYQNSCPLLVPLIEEGWLKKPETKMLVRKCLAPLKMKQIDTLILGCTHYPLLYKYFSRKSGRNCQVIPTGKVVACSLANYLERHPEIEKKIKKGDNHQFFVSDITPHFREIASKWLERKIKLKLLKN